VTGIKTALINAIWQSAVYVIYSNAPMIIEKAKSFYNKMKTADKRTLSKASNKNSTVQS
jgi:hypothetical protein